MNEKIYRLNIYKYGSFKIDTLEVVTKTNKTVVVRIYHKVGEGFRRACTDRRYTLKSSDWIFYDTMKDAERAATNVIANRIAYHKERAEELQTRLQEVCEHKEIMHPNRDSRCIRCNLRVPNPDDYSNGG